MSPEHGQSGLSLRSAEVREFIATRRTAPMRMPMRRDFFSITIFLLGVVVL